MFLGSMEIKFKVGIEGYFATGDFLVGMETDQVITLEKKKCVSSVEFGDTWAGYFMNSSSMCS